ncbi:cwf21-domain-containing protein [Neoconidiobolus thromboides FSU 785]|nr:cwf21-domain-containing protein [Neoconidiobolus thromboides FSU 785]
MYNGIGLNTARGSGTNGYVVKNLSNVKPRSKREDSEENSNSTLLPNRKPDKEILLHEKKRKIEVECMELRVELEDEGLEEEDIDDKVDALRQKLLKEFDRGLTKNDQKHIEAHEVHKLAEAKLKQNKTMMKALGIKEDDLDVDKPLDQEQEEVKEIVEPTRREVNYRDMDRENDYDYGKDNRRGDRREFRREYIRDDRRRNRRDDRRSDWRDNRRDDRGYDRRDNRRDNRREYEREPTYKKADTEPESRSGKEAETIHERKESVDGEAKERNPQVKHFKRYSPTPSPEPESREKYNSKPHTPLGSPRGNYRRGSYKSPSPKRN